MVSANDVVPAVFSLSFNVSDGPPSNITCSINGVMIALPEELIIREVLEPVLPILTRVTIIFSAGEEGQYNCTVSNSRVDEGTLDGVIALAGSFQQEIKGENMCKLFQLTDIITVFQSKTLRLYIKEHVFHTL